MEEVLWRSSFVSVKVLVSGELLHCSTAQWTHTIHHAVHTYTPLQLAIAVFTKVSQKWTVHLYSIPIDISPSRHWNHYTTQQLVARNYDFQHWLTHSYTITSRQAMLARNQQSTIVLSNRAQAMAIFNPPNDCTTQALLHSIRSTVDDWVMGRFIHKTMVKDNCLKCMVDADGRLCFFLADSFQQFLVTWIVAREFRQVAVHSTRGKTITLCKLEQSIQLVSNNNKAVEILELISKSKKTLVGMNMLQDLAHLHAAMISGYNIQQSPAERMHLMANDMRNMFQVIVDIDLLPHNDKYPSIWQLYDNAAVQTQHDTIQVVREQDAPEGFDCALVALEIGKLYINHMDNQEVFLNQKDQVYLNSVGFRSQEEHIPFKISLMEISGAQANPTSSSNKRELPPEDSKDDDVSQSGKKRFISNASVL